MLLVAIAVVVMSVELTVVVVLLTLMSVAVTSSVSPDIVVPPSICTRDVGLHVPIPILSIADCMCNTHCVSDGPALISSNRICTFCVDVSMIGVSRFKVGASTENCVLLFSLSSLDLPTMLLPAELGPNTI